MRFLKAVAPSFGLSVLIFLTAIVVFVLQMSGDRLSTVVLSDALGYYQYLPGLFIEHDLNNLPYAIPLENGNHLNVYHIGVAILQSPFFLAAHALAILFGFEANGYSPIYVYALAVSAAFYLGVGIYFLQRFLECYFHRALVIGSLLIIYLGTNLFYYASMEPAMSHIYSFSLCSLFIFLTHRFYIKLDYKKALMIGLVFGLILIVRPTNGIVLIFLLFYNVSNAENIRERFRLFLQKYRLFVLMGTVALGVCFIQMSYWKHVSGDWVVFSYGQLGQKFFWTKAQLGNVLFSHQNGFLIYAPVMAFALAGMFLGSFKNRYNLVISTLIWLLAWYIFSSWWAWWFGGAYGHRAFIDYFPLMAIGMTFFIQTICPHKYLRYLTGIIIVVFLFINVRMCFLYRSPWDGQDWNWDSYFTVLQNVFFIL